MLNTLTLDSVESFLKICRKEIKRGRFYFVGTRHINMNGNIISAKQALINLGIMDIEDVWKYVLELTKEDCIKVDFDYDHTRDTNSEIFIFKKTINQKLVYIKLTMRTKGVICISFHESY